MKIDQEEFNRKAQHIIDTVVKPQVKKYERAKVIAEAAANLADPNVDKTDNWIAGAKWQSDQDQEDINKLISIIEWYDNESDVRPHVEIFMWFEQFKKK